MKCNIKIDNSVFVETFQENEDLDWEDIDRNYVDPLTYMVSQNCNEKFKTSYLGKFFNPSFFEKKEKSVKSSFESGFFCHATLVVVYFSCDDIIAGNNPIYDFVSQFNEISDFNNLVFAMEVNYLDTDMQKFEKIRFFMDVNKHSHHRDWELSDMESFAELQKKVAKLEFPSWCETFRNKIYHYSYELHPVVLSENIDLNVYKDDMNGLFDIIEDCLTVFEMEQL